MHNHQRHPKSINISKLGVIVLSIALIAGISFIPVLQAGVYAQQKQLQQSQQPPLQQQQQLNRVGLSQVIKQIAQQVATANPSNNATNVYQILVQLAKLTAQTTSKEKAIEDIRQISSQVDRYPYGIVSQSLALFAQQVVSAAGGGRSINTPNSVQIAQQIAQDKSSSTGQNVTQSLVNKAVQTATGANSNNINQHLRQIAQIISKQTGVPVQKVESILIQLTLQIAQTQGKDITGQSISQIANQITNNPNGIFTQLILQLLKQDRDDNGKSSNTVEIIKTVVRGGGGGDTNINIKNNINNYNNNQPPSNTDTKTGGTTTALSLGNTPITTGPITIHLCFVCASGNDVDYHRVNNIATGTAQLTGVSTEAAELAVSDIYLRTTNKAGSDQASRALASFEADAAATTNPATLDKIGDLAKLYDSGHEDIAYRASDSISDKLSTGENPTMALVRTSIPDSTSLSSIDEVTAAAVGEQGGGATAIAGGTTTTNTDTDDGTGDTALGKDDTDTGDDGDSGDSGHSGNSGDSGDGGDSEGGTTGGTSTGTSGSIAGGARGGGGGTTGGTSTGTSGSIAGGARGGGGDSK